ncbi:MAG: hypothetical protein ABID35_05455 [Candidatus Margulisiibacteriota bacterium]
MGIKAIIMLYKVLGLISGLITAWFGIMLLLFYNKFSAFNHRINARYLIGGDKYGDGSSYKIDALVLRWHTIIAIFCLLVAAWLFWTFYINMKL